ALIKCFLTSNQGFLQKRLRTNYVPAPVNKEEHQAVIHYELPHWRFYLVLTLLGSILTFIYRRWLRMGQELH
ncbi:hypothetical protein ACEE08_02220, partial [Staphylococcus rostri]